jgi:hypothetical protein
MLVVGFDMELGNSEEDGNLPGDLCDSLGANDEFVVWLGS